MGRKKVTTTVYLDEMQLDALDRLSEVMDKPVAELIRNGIDLVLEREKANIPQKKVRKNDLCIYCGHDFGTPPENVDSRPVKCDFRCIGLESLPRTGDERGWLFANSARDVMFIMVKAQKEMRDLGCHPPSGIPKTRL